MLNKTTLTPFSHRAYLQIAGQDYSFPF
uniref:Uncharacterized protein n=1 Tax=Anguilla anguilla TaxID=7936 RepID=A0A0E9SKS3_ANGAN